MYVYLLHMCEAGGVGVGLGRLALNFFGSRWKAVSGMCVTACVMEIVKLCPGVLVIRDHQ